MPGINLANRQGISIRQTYPLEILESRRKITRKDKSHMHLLLQPWLMTRGRWSAYGVSEWRKLFWNLLDGVGLCKHPTSIPCYRQRNRMSPHLPWNPPAHSSKGTWLLRGTGTLASLKALSKPPCKQRPADLLKRLRLPIPGGQISAPSNSLPFLPLWLFPPISLLHENPVLASI